VSAPTSRNNDIVEYMGFQYCLPCTDDVSNPTDVNNQTAMSVDDDKEEAEEPTGESTNVAMQEDFGDDFDIEVLLVTSN
jgi:hypothetical protein